MTTPTTSLPPVAWDVAVETARLKEQHANRLVVERLAEELSLPAPTIVARPELVYVSVADPDELVEWLGALGGEIQRSAVFEGVQLWSLRTFALPSSSGSRVPVRVSVPVPVGESVMPELLRAVAS
ncbi:hypothetical protein ACH4E8_29600 [Streptomyces sp. NPDC017979]|uniref:hypothetical protein n=1 Tax=Streptomyces sp. NPDC017979 TaxID=3365024 RepID=UPI003797F2FC